MRRFARHDLREGYRPRVMACLAATLLLLIGAVKLWPPPEAAEAPVTFHTRAPEVIQLEEVQPTRQEAGRKPPPPTPLLPIVVPNEVVLEEVPLELSDNRLPVEEPGATDDGAAPVPAPNAGPTGPVARPDTGPKTVRFVEPEYTREARRRKVRAELVVEVLVDERGRVQETKIVERFLLGEDQADRKPVAELGYGLEEAALAAAERWVFRPARHNGRPVASYTTLTFTFGV